MQLKIILQKDIPDYKQSLLEFHDPENKRPTEYWKSLQNSSCIIIAFEDEKIIGACRITTDFYMCATIFDVLVHVDYRNQGIGGKIMEKTVEFFRENNIRNVGLITDPSYEWLPNFYKKFGFEIDNSRGMYMILER
ncbi:MAG: GNAT family N-acetyltransferase [Candidatus Gracilibacteria bacterium]|jgi:spermidine synthase